MPGRFPFVAPGMTAHPCAVVARDGPDRLIQQVRLKKGIVL